LQGKKRLAAAFVTNIRKKKNKNTKEMQIEGVPIFVGKFVKMCENCAEAAIQSILFIISYLIFIC